MSTFNGNIVEFPDIRVDYFGANDQRPPLACLLSHVHTDHTVGLETLTSPFVYCSLATREILLRLEKYPHRMNFAKGILERRKQTYRHLKKILKAIPLETPTVIELSPGKSIRITLFDANHCVGAVMFLIEGDGKAVIYTGDIRSEPWWVDSLKRQPLLIPFVSTPRKKALKQLDAIYLDTTFVVRGKEDLYRHFPSKAEGLRELIDKVAQYPKDTLFYIDSWTFGYEDVWQTLSAFLDAQIHVDDYRYGLYRALANSIDPKPLESSKLLGFYCGNHFQNGCLTPQQSRVHSCEPGIGCPIWDEDFVRITPIISRYDGVELRESGAGGGHGDLDQRRELELNVALVDQLTALCASKLQGQPQLFSAILEMLRSMIERGVKSVRLNDSNTGDFTVTPNSIDHNDVPLERIVPALATLVTKSRQSLAQKARISNANHKTDHGTTTQQINGLPKQINFPYSRHSSYLELCLLIEAFRPKDIYPCIVKDLGWTAASSMSALFGHLYQDAVSFRHDHEMLKKQETSAQAEPRSRSSSMESSLDETSPQGRGCARTIQESRRDYVLSIGFDEPSSTLPQTLKRPCVFASPSRGERRTKPVVGEPGAAQDLTRSEFANIYTDWRGPDIDITNEVAKNREVGQVSAPSALGKGGTQEGHSVSSKRSGITAVSSSSSGEDDSRLTPADRIALRQCAYDAAVGSKGAQWSDGFLVSTGGHQVREEEL